MTVPVDVDLGECSLRSGASTDAIGSAEAALQTSLPSDLRALYLRSDGAEGFLSEHQYFVVWPIGELAELNVGHAVDKHAPGITLFGGDGADTGFGFRGSAGAVIYGRVPLIGMSAASFEPLGSTLATFLRAIAGGD